MSRGGGGLDHGEVVFELDVVHHPPGDQVRDPLAHLVFGQHDVVRADPFEDPAVLAADGLGPDVGDRQVDQHRGGEDAGFEVVADADHRALVVGHVELAQRLGVGGVGDRGVGELVGEALHDALRCCRSPRTSVPRRTSSSASDAPNRPRPSTTTRLAGRVVVFVI